MAQRNVDITTEDGTSDGSLHVPDGSGPHGSGPWPAVIMYPDAGGLRDTLRDMGDQLAGLGYVTLVPNFYYRAGDFPPFDMTTLFGNPDERERLMVLVRGVTVDMAVRDTNAYIDYLTSLPETTGDAVGTTGYCMGGRLSLLAAGHLGDRVAAAASFHGGYIAAPDDPDSPHLLAGKMTATVYVAGASDDPSFTADHRALLEQALTDGGVTHTIETYAAGHGFAVPDNATYDAVAADRHWNAMSNLFGSTLAP